MEDILNLDRLKRAISTEPLFPFPDTLRFSTYHWFIDPIRTFEFEPSCIDPFTIKLSDQYTKLIQMKKIPMNNLIYRVRTDVFKCYVSISKTCIMGRYSYTICVPEDVYYLCPHMAKQYERALVVENAKPGKLLIRYRPDHWYRIKQNNYELRLREQTLIQAMVKLSTDVQNNYRRSTIVEFIDNNQYWFSPVHNYVPPSVHDICTPLYRYDNTEYRTPEERYPNIFNKTAYKTIGLPKQERANQKWNQIMRIQSN